MAARDGSITPRQFNPIAPRALRPQSAGVLPRSTRHLIGHATTTAVIPFGVPLPSHDESPQSRIRARAEATAATPRPRPRPPSASSIHSASTSSGARQQRMHQHHNKKLVDCPIAATTGSTRVHQRGNQEDPKTSTVSVARWLRSPSAAYLKQSPQVNEASRLLSLVSPLVLREEIETQRIVTRRAQRECNALHLQIVNKTRERELLQRHYQAFDSNHRQEQADHQSDGGVVTRVAALRDQIRRSEAYRKTLRCMLDRVTRQVQLLHANMELWRARLASATREHGLLQDKLAQEINQRSELVHQRTAMMAARGAERMHEQQVLASLQDEITSRSLVMQQRHEADQRREEMLRLMDLEVTARTNTRSTIQSVEEATPVRSGPKGVSFPQHRDSLQVLIQDSAAFLAAVASPPRKSCTSSFSSSTLTAHTNTDSGTGALLPQYVALGQRREALYQLYESQYARIVEETKEPDLEIAMERFVSFDEARRRLESIALEVVEEHGTLLARHEQCCTRVQQLRESGVAEVEKRKQMRDDIEQVHHDQISIKTHTRERFLHQLKMYSCIQQGIRNIGELMHCLEGGTPTTETETTGASPSPPSESELEHLVSLLRHADHVMRHCSNSSGELTAQQIARLAQVDPMLSTGNSMMHPNRFDINNDALTPPTTGHTSQPAATTSAFSSASACGSSSTSVSFIRAPPAAIESRHAPQASEQVRVNRERIKKKEADTLLQVELLRKSMAATDATNAMTLEAVHAYFREKRLQEKEDQQHYREWRVSNALTSQAPATGGDSAPGDSSHKAATGLGCGASGASLRRSSGAKPSAIKGTRAVSRRKSSLVSFALPLEAGKTDAQARRPSVPSSGSSIGGGSSARHRSSETGSSVSVAVRQAALTGVVPSARPS